PGGGPGVSAYGSLLLPGSTFTLATWLAAPELGHSRNRLLVDPVSHHVSGYPAGAAPAFSGDVPPSGNSLGPLLPLCTGHRQYRYSLSPAHPGLAGVCGFRWLGLARAP